MVRRRSKTYWRGGFDWVVLFLLAGTLYLAGVLLNFSWTGKGGLVLGAYLRSTWGGALLVPVAFLFYLCVAWMIRTKIPRPLGQIIGTLQLYLTLAFTLGLARHAGWALPWALTESGRVGNGLANFFILNLGNLGALLLAFALLALASVLFGFRLPVYLFQSLGQRFAEKKSDRRPGRRTPRPGTAPQSAPPARSRPLSQKKPSSMSLDGMEMVGEKLVRPSDYREPLPEAAGGFEFPAAETSKSVSETPVPEPFVSKEISREIPKEIPREISREIPKEIPKEIFREKAPSPDINLNPATKARSAAEILEDLLASLDADEPMKTSSPNPEQAAEAVQPAAIRHSAVQPAVTQPETVRFAAVQSEAVQLAAIKPEFAPPEDIILSETVPPEAIEPEVQAAEPAVNDFEERIQPPQPLPPGGELPETEGTAIDQAQALLSKLSEELTDGGMSSAVQEAFPDADLPDAGETDPRVAGGAFPPPLDIFGPPASEDEEDDTHQLAEEQAGVIVETLQNFGVRASVAHIVIGPSVIQFQLELAPGIKVSKVSGLANDLTMALAVVSVRVEAPILGQRYVGLEIPNPRRKGITLRSVMESTDFQESESVLPLPMGVRVDSKHLICGLEDMPHLLVAGTTGSGKSVFMNTCILGMCSQRSPEELKLILVDPKHVEFAIYEGLPHLLARPVSDPKKAISALGWAVQEMETRSEAFARTKVRNLASYNEKVLPKNKFPHIVVVVDELADLMYTAGKEVESLIARLAQKARAAGIHLVLATQRPSVDVITGLIKANVPARVAFAVPSQTDSRTIIDTGGAEKLLGKGDMLFYSSRYPRPLRLQASFITEECTLDFVEYMKNVFGEPEYIEFDDFVNGNGGGNGGNGERSGGSAVDDPKLEEAIKTVMETGIASASGLQRYLNVGYPRAGRLISGLEQLGIVGPQAANSSKPREILMDEEGAFDVLERARSGDSL